MAAAVPEVDETFIRHGSFEDDLAHGALPTPFIGLWNLGNSCFFNSVLQILFFCPGFQNHVDKSVLRLKAIGYDSTSMEDVGASTKMNKKHKLLVELQRLFAIMRGHQNTLLHEPDHPEEYESVKAVRPCRLIEAFREVHPTFEPYTQQDAQECLRCIMDTLHDALLTLSRKKEITKSKIMTSSMTCKMFGGRKPGSSYVVSNFAARAEVENRDPNRHSHIKESRTTASRKQGVLGLLKKSHKRKPKMTEQCLELRSARNRPLCPLAENTKIAKGRFKPTKSPSKRLTTRSEPLVPPAKKMKPPRNRMEGSRGLKSEIPIGMKTCVTKNPIESIPKTDSCVGDVVVESGNKLVTAQFSEKCTTLENKAQYNFIEDLFQGKLINEVRCMECENCVQSMEIFLDISLPVGDQINNTNSSCSGSLPVEGDCSITWGLSLFASHEILGGENKYHCKECNRHVEGERKVSLHSLPPMLTFHLKRFTSAKPAATDTFPLPSSGGVVKITRSLRIPLELNLDKWSTPSCKNRGSKYLLFGVIVHSGISIFSGHYLSYVRHKSSWVALDDVDTNTLLGKYDENWLEVDDDKVRTVTNEELLNLISPKDLERSACTPYLLFYHREAAP